VEMLEFGNFVKDSSSTMDVSWVWMFPVTNTRTCAVVL
jgi:hypothetical protein